MCAVAVCTRARSHHDCRAGRRGAQRCRHQPAAWYRFSAGHGLVLILGDAQAGGLHRRGLGIGMEIGSYTFAIPMTLNSSCLLLDVRYLLSTSCSCIYYLKITSETSLSGYGCTRPQIMFVCVLLYIFAAQSTVSRLSSAVQGRISARSRETQRPCHCFYHPHRPTPPRCFKYIKHSFCTTLAGCKTLA